ncbi:hypothetical protein FQN50_009801 [Emmonsiellopsis sp. PD_5]|nr:hypothetical protein FQN50_009801 [Emmonsiellopsis sp. PD_5]
MYKGTKCSMSHDQMDNIGSLYDLLRNHAALNAPTTGLLGMTCSIGYPIVKDCNVNSQSSEAGTCFVKC